MGDAGPDDFERLIGASFQQFGAEDRDLWASPGVAAEARQHWPEEIGGHRVIELIAVGGVGRVFRCVDHKLDRELAIKLLRAEFRDDPEIVDGFLHEARVCCWLGHPNIVPVYEIGRSEDGCPFFSMRLIAGETLADHLARVRPSASGLQALLEILLQVCRAISHAHSRGIVHTDLKPANVMIGEFGEVYVVDWGFARNLSGEEGPGSPLAGQTRAAGTPAYMAPEQTRKLAGVVDARSDVFALGCVLREVLLTALEVEDVNAPEVPAEPGALCHECLEEDPAKRPQDAGRVAASIEGYLASAELAVRRAELEAAVARASATREKERRRLILGIALVLVVALGAALVALSSRQALDEQRLDTLLTVRAAIQRAGEMEAAAVAAAAPDPTAWEAALSVLAPAHGLLAQIDDTDLPQQVAGLEARIHAGRARAARDAETMRWYEDELPHLADDRDVAAMAAEFAACFARYGLDPMRTDAEAAEALAGSGIPEPLAATLMRWAQVGRNGEEGRVSWQALAELALVVDRDPQRSALRQAWIDGDHGAMLEVAESGQFDAAGPSTVVEAIRLLRRGADAERFLAVLRRAQRQYPGEYWVQHEAGWHLAHHRPEAREEALRALTTAVSLRPESAHAWVDLGAMQQMVGESAAAEQSFRRAIHLDPTHSRSWSPLVSMLVGRRDWQGLTELLNHGLEARSEDVRFLVLAGTVALALGSPEVATALLPTALDPSRAGPPRASDRPAAWSSLAMCEVLHGDFDAADARLTQCVDAQRDSVQWLRRRGQVRLVSGRYADAVADLERVCELVEAGGEPPASADQQSLVVARRMAGFATGFENAPASELPPVDRAQRALVALSRGHPLLASQEFAAACQGLPALPNAVPGLGLDRTMGSYRIWQVRMAAAVALGLGDAVDLGTEERRRWSEIAAAALSAELQRTGMLATERFRSAWPAFRMMLYCLRHSPPVADWLEQATEAMEVRRELDELLRRTAPLLELLR